MWEAMGSIPSTAKKKEKRKKEKRKSTIHV
jgi:hypothetical protein